MYHNNSSICIHGNIIKVPFTADGKSCCFGDTVAEGKRGILGNSITLAKLISHVKEIAERADKISWCYNENRNLEKHDANDGLYGGCCGPITFHFSTDKAKGHGFNERIMISPGLFIMQFHTKCALLTKLCSSNEKNCATQKFTVMTQGCKKVNGSKKCLI